MEVRFFKKSEDQLLLNSIDKLWSHNHVYVRKAELLNHLVLNTPYRKEFSGDENTSFLGMWDNNEVVGLLGAIPQKMNMFGIDSLATTVTIWKIDPEYRIYGLCLMEHILKKKPKIHLSIGINDTVKKLYKAMGWNIIEDFPRWIGINNRAGVERFLLNQNKHQLLEFIPDLCIRESSEKFKSEDYIDEKRWDKFYWSKFATKTIGIARDYQFLKWRYMDYPEFNYQFIALKNMDGEYEGLAVIRIEEILKQKMKIGRILEFISVNPECSVELANQVIMFDKDVLCWDFYCMSGVTAWGLEAVGFRRIPETINKVLIPTRFQPVDLENFKIKAAIYVSEEAKKEINNLNDHQWYITKGDADQDRPN